MDLQEAIQHSKDKKGMKLCVSGLFIKSAEILELSAERPTTSESGGGYAFVLTEMATHFDQAREAWLNGDLETVAQFFGLYV